MSKPSIWPAAIASFSKSLYAVAVPVGLFGVVIKVIPGFLSEIT
jgi:uncharacterized membrane protein YiaA